MHRLAIVALVLSLASSLACGQEAKPAPPPQQADVAAPKIDAKTGEINERFKLLHEQYVTKAKAADTDLLFLGDSITEGWRKQAEVWDDHFKQYKPANFGIGGDRTQHVLWRIENGELDPPFKPKLVVLMIGTNNSGNDPADKIASGVEKIVKTIRDKTGAKVLLLAVFPRGDQAKPDDMKRREVIKGVNEQIKKLDDGKAVRYLDIGSNFISAEGEISTEIMPDRLHLSRKGYELWANAIDKPVKEMMSE